MIKASRTMFAPLGLFNNLTIRQFNSLNYSGQKNKAYKMTLEYELPL
jgi:hypothetical protein